MTTITEYRDGFINQKGASGSSFRIDGNVYTSSTSNASGILAINENINFLNNIKITSTNTTNFNNNTSQMYWTCLSNSIEYDLIDQVFDKDIIVSKQLNYLTESVSETGDYTAAIVTDHDGTNGGAFDMRFGDAAYRYLPNSGNNIRLYNPNNTYPGAVGKPDWWITNEIAPYFDGLEISFFKTDAAAADIFNDSSAALIFYHNNPTRVANPAGNHIVSTFKTRARQQIKAKIIKIAQPNTYGWHIMEGKTPAP